MAALSVPEALQLLQLEPGATRKQIRAAYKRLALQLHPDKQHQQQSADATAAFARLSAAYSLLVQGLRNNHARDRSEEHNETLPPFEAAYATGSLFSEQLVDEAVLVGTDAADIWTLQQLAAASAAGQLAQHVAANPPTASDEQLWKQLYARLELRQQVRQMQHQQQQQQQEQRQQQRGGVGIGELLTDLLLRPTGPLFVEDSECESDAGTDNSSEEGARATVYLQHRDKQQQQQQLLLSAAAASSKQQQQLQVCSTNKQHQQQQQQQPHEQQALQTQPHEQQQEQQRGDRPPKQLRHGWGFYWMWLRRALLAKALLSLVSSGLKSKLYEHRFPKPLPLQ